MIGEREILLDKGFISIQVKLKRMFVSPIKVVAKFRRICYILYTFSLYLQSFLYYVSLIETHLVNVVIFFCFVIVYHGFCFSKCITGPFIHRGKRNRNHQ